VLDRGESLTRRGARVCTPGGRGDSGGLARAGKTVGGIGIDRDSATGAGWPPRKDADFRRARARRADRRARQTADVQTIRQRRARAKSRGCIRQAGDADDQATSRALIAEVARLLPHLRDGPEVVMCRRKLPVGSVAARGAVAGAALRVSPDICGRQGDRRCSATRTAGGRAQPHLGGVRSDAARADRGAARDDHDAIEWMSVESAEMTSAINAVPRVR